MLSPQSQPLRDYTNIKFKILIVVFNILGALGADIFLSRLGGGVGTPKAKDSGFR
jgi:hypothetical protein